MTAQTSLQHADLPLAGVRVVEFATGIKGAIGRWLAELGADVVKIEPASQTDDRQSGRMVDGVSLDFVHANLGKRFLALNMDEDVGQATLDSMLRESDILILASPSGAASDQPLDDTTLHARYPELVILSVTDFGKDNSLSDWRGGDAVFQALSAQLSRSGMAGREPLLSPGNIAIQSAIVQAVLITLTAYLNRLKTGHGDIVDFAALEGATQALDPGYGVQGSATSGVPKSKIPRDRPTAGYQYPILSCADGDVRLCLLAPRQWHSMFEWMGSPEEFADPSYDKLAARYKSKTLLPAITRFFADKTRLELEAEGEKRGIPIASVKPLKEALHNEQFQARQIIREVTLPNGQIASMADSVFWIDNQRTHIPQSMAAPEPEFQGWAPRPDFGTPEWADTSVDRPLAGLRVVDFGIIVVGAEQSRLLADLGADVIKIENPAFPDGMRQTRGDEPITLSFATGHRNKRSLAINLKDEKGRALLLDLIADADVLLSNFKPGTLESLGLDEATLRAANPKLVMAESSAFGATGPWSKRMGYGPLVRTAAGLTELWHYPGEHDTYSDTVTVYPDHVAGRIDVIGALALLIRRARSGQGGKLAVSQAEVILYHLSTEMAAMALPVDTSRPITGPAAGTRGVYPCDGDDEWCVVDVHSDEELASLCAVLGRPVTRIYSDIEPDLRDWLAGQSPYDAADQLQSAGVRAAPMLRVLDLPHYPYFQERKFLRQLDHPALDKPYPIENAPMKSLYIPEPREIPAPLMGEHSREIATERMKLDAQQIDALVEQGVLHIGPSLKDL